MSKEKEIGCTLKCLLDRVIDGNPPNDRDELMEAAIKYESERPWDN